MRLRQARNYGAKSATLTQLHLITHFIKGSNSRLMGVIMIRNFGVIFSGGARNFFLQGLSPSPPFLKSIAPLKYN